MTLQKQADQEIARISHDLGNEQKNWNQVPENDSGKSQDASISKEPPYQKANGFSWAEVANVLEEECPSATLLDKQHIAQDIDERDEGTPDDWVQRNPSLIRLTGRHPFNAEPPLSTLLDQGFITPISLHVVRAHTSIPKIAWDDHKLTITGLVSRPLTLTMDELVNLLPTVTMPVTVLCAGNRRKEENMIRKTIGFNWGCGGLSCNMWTGIRLRELLLHCGINLDRARHVLFVGAKIEKLPNGDGTYGTSIDINRAMDPLGEVFVAWEQNGVRLTPDHGFPLRVIIPGMIGGRMVKFLEQIVVSETPSENHYHYYDNRVFPPHVDAETALAEGYYYRPEYLFNQFNINSAIVYPQNGEIMSLNRAGVYTVRGYAYSGGGRKVTRVELSFDGGKTWEPCEVDYPEERYSHAPKLGRYYCWMFWEYTADKFQFLDVATGCGEIRVRAWDEACNTQPSEPTWNLMGMANNCHFTVKVVARQTAGSFGLEFLHPTVPGSGIGGWMIPAEPSHEATSRVYQSQAISSSISPNSRERIKTFTMDEVHEHNCEKSAWIVVDNKVYDTTKFLEHHPGGPASILVNAGTDATTDFMAIHSDEAKELLKDFYIGDLRDSVSSSIDVPAHSAHSAPAATSLMRRKKRDLVALNPKKWISFELIEKESVSHDTRLFRFKAQPPAHRLGLPVGHHMFIQAHIDNKLVIRAYTPVWSDDKLGTFTLCMKVYHKNSNPRFPGGGKMSQYVDNLNIGDCIRVKGPLGEFEYKGRGIYMRNGEEGFASAIGLICGGTGLAPGYQVMHAIYTDPGDKTEVFLLYANKTEEDILMRKGLENMAKRENIHVWYTLDQPSESWQYSKGLITEDTLKRSMPPPSDETLICMCGPPPMINYACIPNLLKLGYTESHYMSF